jgi:selenide,water dikinase
VLAANVRAALDDGALEPHRTRRRFLALVSTGSRRALGVWNGFSWHGAWLWRVKDGIDRRFVARYNELG